MKSKKPYDVGYGKPPKATQFKKGTSGNKKGRPKGSRNFQTDVQDVLSYKVPIVQNGRSRKVTSQRAILMGVTGKALAGDHKASEKMLSLAKELHEEHSSRKQEHGITKSERDILDRYKAAVLASHVNDDDGGSSDD